MTQRVVLSDRIRFAAMNDHAVGYIDHQLVLVIDHLQNESCSPRAMIIEPAVHRAELQIERLCSFRYAKQTTQQDGVAHDRIRIVQSNPPPRPDVFVIDHRFQMTRVRVRPVRSFSRNSNCLHMIFKPVKRDNAIGYGEVQTATGLSFVGDAISDS